ncbi:methyl-accepting chemotaxis protein [Chitinasiproducens palmae]|uniref:Methyl-accepting chemotaxis protein/methyl-accepting chemotaxis protein-1, serine sensor receptor n=1 Tax=Chitinasiproducens palmae TaxID=1770053 RepID=A0A1H2PQE5_9BURK|nr:methyl-accepting chemotaxis protein [Chitinasiproducens palmae]SDV49055.1 methyl-accepting chemotaxis protein/methyl-accepting chemotaxis protein-1, serine sensor receptor [Chitinasiproducens palmae]
MFRNLSVGRRLASGFAVVLVLFGVTAALSIYQMTVSENHFQKTFSDAEEKENLATRIRAGFDLRAIAARNVAMVSDPAAQPDEVARATAGKKAIDDAMTRLATLPMDASERASLKRLVDLETQYAPVAQDIIALAVAQRQPEAIQHLTGQCMPLLNQVIEELDRLTAEIHNASLNAAEQQHQSSRMAVFAILTLTGLALVVGVWVAVAVSRSLLRQLGGEPVDAARVAADIAAGRLGTVVPVREGDRDSLMTSLETMRATLARTVADIQASSEAIALAAGEIAQGNTDLSRRTEAQAGALQETASSMEELTATVRQNADNAQRARELSARTSELAARGGVAVEQVVGTMAGISESSARVADIIDVIDGIAFQTNILALNAAVEAARAGEHGRGFAVVAGEVRTLAQRSATAAREIKTLIDTSLGEVKAGAGQVQAAGARMNEIVTSVADVTALIGGIADASDQQRAGIEQVNQAVGQMDSVTQQNAALVEQASAAALAMADQAEQLRQGVATFSLHDDDARRSARPQSRTNDVPTDRSAWSPSGVLLATAARMPERLATAPVRRATPTQANLNSPASVDADWERF